MNSNLDNYTNEIINVYNLKIKSLIAIIKKKDYAAILLQLPDGLKPAATYIADNIRRKTKAEVFIWLGSCYGFCDLPLRQAEQLFSELGKKNKIKSAVIHFGHSVWPFMGIVKGKNVIEI